MIDSIAGKSRVLIENVSPVVDNGLYPVKRTVGEEVRVSANIFADGHDHIRAHLWYKKNEAKDWNVLPMQALGNDAWEASFVVTESGTYSYTVVAWIDHLETWYDGFRKKVAAGLNVATELLEGIELLQQIESSDKSIPQAIKKLQDEKGAITYAMSPEFAGWIDHLNLIQHETIYPNVYLIVVEFKKANFSSWYELFPRSASLENKPGTLKDVITLLPRVAAMGFDVLYLPPVHPIGKLNRKGKNNSVTSSVGEPGSPWAIGSDEGGHKAIHPALGTLQDYQHLIAEAKKLRIDVALDLAFQCAPDHPYVKEHPEWFKQRPDGTIQYAENPPKKYQDIYPFNFECDAWQALWEELKSVVFFWIDHGVKIFRVDNPHTKPIPFWQWIIAEVNKKYNDIIFLSEAFTRPTIMGSLAKVGFTQSYTYFAWRVEKQEIITYMKELVEGPSRNYFRPNFWPNTPDILPYHLQHQSENIFIIRLALAATLSSNYGIYGPAYEFCSNEPIEGKEEYFNSEKFEIKHYDWKKTNRMTDIITIINRVRHDQPALQSTWNIQFCEIQNPKLIAYYKYDTASDNHVLVVVNLDPHNKQSGYVQLPGALLQGQHLNIKAFDTITEEQYTWTQEWNYIELDPHKIPFHIFTLSIHESHM